MLPLVYKGILVGNEHLYFNLDNPTLHVVVV